jgi:transcription-repair coupling factor (superfamily II helicase)
MSQLTTGERDEVVLLPVSEVLLTADSIERFRTGYPRAFRQCRRRRHPLRGRVCGAAPCRHGTLVAAVPRADGDADRLLLRRGRHVGSPDQGAFDSRWELIADYYDARQKTGRRVE